MTRCFKLQLHHLAQVIEDQKLRYKDWTFVGMFLANCNNFSIGELIKAIFKTTILLERNSFEKFHYAIEERKFFQIFHWAIEGK